MAQDPQAQIQIFASAVEALGGQRATARHLGMSERTVRFLLAGDKALHDGILRDTAKALIEHADLCRQLERQLSPAFAGNLTQRQLERMGKPDARRLDQAEHGRRTEDEFRADCDQMSAAIAAQKIRKVR